jgi:hypothetical protein
LVVLIYTRVLTSIVAVYQFLHTVAFRATVDAQREIATERLLGVATSRRARRATAPAP